MVVGIPRKERDSPFYGSKTEKKKLADKTQIFSLDTGPTWKKNKQNRIPFHFHGTMKKLFLLFGSWPASSQPSSSQSLPSLGPLTHISLLPFFLDVLYLSFSTASCQLLLDILKQKKLWSPDSVILTRTSPVTQYKFESKTHDSITNPLFRNQ